MALGMANVEGIFYLLVMGVVLAIIIAIIDVLLESRTRSKELEVRSGFTHFGHLIEIIDLLFAVLVKLAEYHF